MADDSLEQAIEDQFPEQSLKVQEQQPVKRRNTIFSDEESENEKSSGQQPNNQSVSGLLSNQNKSSSDRGTPEAPVSEPIAFENVVPEEDDETMMNKISDLNLNFREQDPKRRLRTQALIQIFEGSARKMFEQTKKISNVSGSLTLTQRFQNDLNQDDVSGDASPAKKNTDVAKKGVTPKKKKVYHDPLTQFYMDRLQQSVLRELEFDIKTDNAEQKKRRKVILLSEQVEESCIPFVNDMDRKKLLWDMFILCLAVLTSFSVGFEFVISSLNQQTWYTVLSILVDILFLFDIALQFRTTYFSVEGEEVRDWKKIANRYLRGMFIIDVIATIPWSSLQIHDTLTLLKIFKVTRITRFSKVIQKLELKEDQKAMVKIFKLILTLLLIMHIIGCLWYLVVQIEQKWVPPLDFIYVQRKGYYRFYDLEEVTEGYQYMVVLYMAVLALGGNEMGPRTTYEIAFIFIILISLILYNAVIFGEMTVLVSEVSKKESGFQQQVDVANTAMKNMDLPKDAQNEVRLYLITTQGTQYEQEQLNSFLKIISPSLNQKVSVEIFTGTVKKNVQFKTAIRQIAQQSFTQLGRNYTKQEINKKENELIKPIVQRMETQLSEPDAVIIQKYQQGQAIYLISKGECLVIVGEESQLKTSFNQNSVKKGDDKAKEKEKLLRPGYLFGEISIVYNCLTTATVQAKKYCNLGKLSKEKYKEIITMQPKINDEIQTGIYDYDDKMLRFIKRSIKQVPYFSHLENSDSILYDIIYTLDTKTMIKGAELQKAGANADELYFLQNGIIEVYTEFEKKEFVIERLFKGSIINYRTFFMEDRGQVSMRFATHSVLKVLTYKKMETLNRKHPSLQKTFDKYRLKIVKDANSIPLDYIMALPMKINEQHIKDTRKKLLSNKQDEYVQRIEAAKQRHRREKGLDMPEDLLKRTIKEIKQEIISDKEVKKLREKTNHLENSLKNIVIRKIVQIREERNKKTIKQAVDAILIKQRAEKDRRSKKVEKYVKREFEQIAATQMDDDSDILYNRVIVNMKRLLKVLTGHSSAIDSLERKLREIQAPKKKKQIMMAALKASKAQLLGGTDSQLQSSDQNANGMDDNGISMFDEQQSQYADEIDILSEGAMEREIMMDQIKMGDVDKMEHYNRYNLRVDNVRDLNINNDNELGEISSEESEEAGDKEDED